MLRLYSQRLALLLFALYVAVFPGSTITVALDRVPAWGLWMGSALLIVQGATMLAWLIGQYKWRGLVGGLLIGLLALVVEYAGVVTGMPFGRYAYTNILQPQIFATVPLAVCCAWITVAAAAYEMTRTAPGSWLAAHRLIATATLVVLLDLQIETVATYANSYWVWFDHGPYYRVPTANFVSWWLIGLLMAWVLSKVEPHTERADSVSRIPSRMSRISQSVLCTIPALLYLMSMTMFTVINLSRGYIIAGLIGVAVLASAGALLIRHWPDVVGLSILRRRSD